MHSIRVRNLSILKQSLLQFLLYDYCDIEGTVGFQMLCVSKDPPDGLE